MYSSDRRLSQWRERCSIRAHGSELVPDAADIMEGDTLDDARLRIQLVALALVSGPQIFQQSCWIARCRSVMDRSEQLVALGPPIPPVRRAPAIFSAITRLPRVWAKI